MKKKTRKLIDEIASTIKAQYPFLSESEKNEILENFIYESILNEIGWNNVLDQLSKGGSPEYVSTGNLGVGAYGGKYTGDQNFIHSIRARKYANRAVSKLGVAGKSLTPEELEALTQKIYQKRLQYRKNKIKNAAIRSIIKHNLDNKVGPNSITPIMHRLGINDY